jgi:Putative porin
MNKMRTAFAPFVMLAVLPCGPAYAQSAADIAGLRQELHALRDEQAKTEAKIDRVEAAINRLTSPATIPSLQFTPNTGPTSLAIVASVQSTTEISGDIRLRYEANFGERDARNRDRSVLRARLRGSYAVTDWLSAGGQLTTGDGDDPNSTDITLSNFDDDLSVSLDQSWLRFKKGKVELTGGKIPLPFVRTDMVWDGDVYPQGASASYVTHAGTWSFKTSALFFMIDESVGGSDSRMIGGQLVMAFPVSTQLKFDVAASYYDYRLRSVAGGDTGDFRSNRFANGQYLSDFDLLDIIGSATWSGFGTRWPVKLNANYVHNLGATTKADTGLLISLLAGRITDRGDWRLGYGYAQTGIDAVFAAVSEDNTTLATNYVQHNISIDYLISPHLTLAGTFYRFKPKSVIAADVNQSNDWLNRLRINLLAEF